MYSFISCAYIEFDRLLFTRIGSQSVFNLGVSLFVADTIKTHGTRVATFVWRWFLQLWHIDNFRIIDFYEAEPVRNIQFKQTF